ncbi:uncharacterized protein LOC116302162 [Actinia tenebrosa]|uniref:Uncharacterized protein LOC116302162 n=1 Tax=Actinia tenebrosa TaxID=6105 RepID=A0A6P8IKG5_ACTTE|nr:uncharacterized protein LOC116302162 [Actinia tenebrosa]
MFLLDRSKTTIDDLRLVSQASREARLDQELARFEENLDIMLADKNTFLLDLYRRLKQARSTYKSWNRRTAGGGRATDFVSVEQIEELVDWQQKKQKRKDKKDSLSVDPDSDQQVDMLLRFLLAFKESKELLEQFRTKIFLPLFEFFNDDPKRHLPKALASVVWRWEGLLTPGPINHRLFSPQSADALYYTETSTKPRDSQFNLILRLVPDLMLKAFEALCLAKQWRSKIGPWGYPRELKYIHSKWIPEKKQENNLAFERAQRRKFEYATCQVKLDALQGEMENTETVLGDSSTGIKKPERETGAISGRFEDVHHRIDNFRENVRTASLERSRLAKDLCKLRDHITMLQEEMKTEQRDIQNIRAQLVKAEMNTKYSDEKEMTKLLEDDLEDSVHRCTHLRKEISKAEQEYKEQMIRYHSTNTRLNSFRRGIDSARSEQLSLNTSLLTTRERQRKQEKSFIAANDNFNLLREELRKSKLTKQVLLRQMLQPRNEETAREKKRTVLDI